MTVEEYNLEYARKLAEHRRVELTREQILDKARKAATKYALVGGIALSVVLLIVMMEKRA